MVANDTPFGRSPIAAPGLIEAEDFDNGGEEIAYHDHDSANLGHQDRTTGVDIFKCADSPNGHGKAIGSAVAGEWLNYTINVATTGIYNLATRLAAVGRGGQYHFTIDGVDITPSTSALNTHSWQKYQTVVNRGISVSAGKHMLTLVLDRNGGSGAVANFNWMQLNLISTPAVARRRRSR